MNFLSSLFVLTLVSSLQYFWHTDDLSVTVQLASPKGLPDLYEASISELQEGLEMGQFTSVDLVKVDYHLWIAT
jgi:hypothetical protein